MNNQKYFFSVDLGATSGRTIIGRIKDNKFELEEVTRFPNNLIVQGGHYYWDIYALYFEIIKGLKEVARRHLDIVSIGIDTWGVDFVMIGEDNAILRNPRAYRDPITFEAMDDYLQNVVTKKEVYDVTGIQFMFFNSLFQLYAMRKEDNSALKHAKQILFVPDALSWMLTGEAVCEYTIASTSQLLDPRTKQLDERLLASVGLDRSKFGKMVMPGTRIGVLTDEVQQLTGLGAVPVIAVAGHDTGSAVAAVPAKNEQFAYLSSGTWSLMGIETKDAIINDLSYDRNFTNEGPDDQLFASPKSMIGAIQQYCRDTHQPVPETPAEICRCIFDSLALRYKQVFQWLQEFAPFELKTLHVIGGGSLNKYLNQFTANATGATVLAGPQEGTAIGNIMLQAQAAGLVKDIWEMRRIIANSLDLVKYEPTDQAAWDKAYETYLNITNNK